MNNETEQYLVHAIIRAFFLLPLSGVFSAFCVFLVGWFVTFGEVEVYEAFMWAVPMGGLGGLFFGLMVVWPLRKSTTLQLMVFLIGGTILGAFPLALIPGVGLPLSWFGGIIGFWAGVATLSNRLAGHKDVAL